MRTQIACEILNNIGADIEDRLEIYREAASAASGQLQALRKVETLIKQQKRNKSLDKATLRFIEKELQKDIASSERHMMGNTSKRDAYMEVVAYLKIQHDKFVKK